MRRWWRAGCGAHLESCALPTWSPRSGLSAVLYLLDPAGLRDVSDRHQENVGVAVFQCHSEVLGDHLLAVEVSTGIKFCKLEGDSSLLFEIDVHSLGHEPCSSQPLNSGLNPASRP